MPDANTWSDNTQYLNYPGLQYLFYKKIKPIKSQQKYKQDDLSWIILFDDDSGTVSLQCENDNQIFLWDDTGSAGKISNVTGEIILYVDALHSQLEGGYIEENGDLTVLFNY